VQRKKGKERKGRKKGGEPEGHNIGREGRESKKCLCKRKREERKRGGRGVKTSV
jgi:hypothetical protein